MRLEVILGDINDRVIRVPIEFTWNGIDFLNCMIALAKFGWGDPRFLFKNFREVTGLCKANLIRDLIDGGQG